ncbi:MAG: UDP-N-acetylmuramoyl-tripeptide--D-alanyl-D-alanine ligase [Clostridia bacterium]|nr:UDP-N-acetylmuramoyl-tripeptide--D-alanyl-D-alanine ligase [Deltaproteobacteria bacterium]
MTSWDLGELARAAGARVTGGALPLGVTAVGTDSRSLPPDGLFVALRGNRFDGHSYVEAAIRAGAVAILVDHEIDNVIAPVPQLVVKDTLRALGDVALYIRTKQPGPVVGVTGSNGKTTTKELIAAALRSGGPVHKTQGNLNNLIGVPLTIASRPDKTWAAVIEMGMNARNEIDRLCEIAAPDVGVITTVGPAHLEGLGTIENVARAKAELFEKLPQSATAVVNADDPHIVAIAEPFVGSRRKVRFGRSSGVDIRIIGSATDTQQGTTRATFEIAGTSVHALIPLVGAHNVSNAAAAIACAWALGVSANDAAQGLRDAQIPGSRARILRDVGPRKVSIIDDTYNANPQSMIASFATLATLAPKSARRIAVVGDMFELGSAASQLHHEVGEAAAQSGAAWVLALGPNASATAEGARSQGARGDAFETIEALNAALDGDLKPGDWLAVKGSRGMNMERVVEHIKAEPSGGAH